MAILRRSIDARFANLDDLKTDPDLDPLRNRGDFKQLLAELEARAKGQAK
jgi:hypothetical protein